MAFLNDKIIAYLTANGVSFAVGDYLTGHKDGEEDSIISWNIDVLGEQPTIDQLDSAYDAKLAAENAVSYRAQRAAEYPAIGDQLDALFHAGLFPAEMAAQIQAVKDAYPKPE